MSPIPPNQPPWPPGPGGPPPVGPQPPPGMMQAGGYPAPPKKSNPTLWIILVLLLAGGGIGAFIVLSGGDDDAGTGTGTGTGADGSTTTSSPDGAVRGYLESSLAGDCATAATFATTEFATTEAAGDCEMPQEEDVAFANVEVLSQEGDNATALATIANRGRGTSYDLTVGVLHVDGAWKVNSMEFGTPVDRSSPEAVVRAYLLRIDVGNCRGAAELAHQVVVDAECVEGVIGLDLGQTFEAIEQGDTATVTVSAGGLYLPGDDAGDSVYELVRVDGDWSISGAR